MSQEQSPATFISFYSFKGGVGRSMALINTAGILAGRRGFRVLVIDLDLEAPGLSYLNPSMPDVSSALTQRELPLQLGFVDLLCDAKRGQAADLFALTAAELAKRYTQEIRLPEELREFKEGSLHIMPAGRFDNGYPQRFDSLNIGELYREGLGEPLIRAFKKKLGEAGLYDYVLVDSRTGFSDEAGICTRDLADHLMVLSGLNRQNVEGTCAFLRALREATQGKKTFQVILSPVPNGEDALFEQREAVAKEAFKMAWGGEVDVSLQIPYHPQLALTEEPHIFRSRRGHLFHAYCAIESSMLDRLGHNVASFGKRINQSLDRKDYLAALRDLRHMIRLDGGINALFWLADELMRSRPGRGRAEAEPTQEKITLDNLLREDAGRSVIEFIVDWLPLGEMDWVSKQLKAKLEDNSPELADRLFKRMDDAAPNNAEMLGDQAIFLADRREDFDSAETYYKRAIEADPKSARHLANYANFLTNRREDLDTAEIYYRRAIEVDPKHVNNLGSYAIFLAERRGDLDTAEIYYKRALEADPKHANSLGNYGQFLAGRGRLEEAEARLVAAFETCDKTQRMNMAELCFSLWLVVRMRGRNADHWERRFKYLIGRGFERSAWSFDRMLNQAETILSEEEFHYAKALAAAFLDESKLPELDQIERWRVLVPSDPSRFAGVPKP